MSTEQSDKQTPEDDAPEPQVIIHHVKGSPATKPRLFHNGKDIFLSLVPLLAICVLVALLSGNLRTRFGPLLPGQKDDEIPPYAAYPAAQAAASQLPFPIRFPQLPPDWKPNSGSRANIGSAVVFNEGWVTAHSRFVQVSSTNAAPNALLSYLSQDSRVEPLAPIHPGWKSYQAADGTRIDLHNFPAVVIGLSGNASASECEVVIKALEKAQPLKTRH